MMPAAKIQIKPHLVNTAECAIFRKLRSLVRTGQLKNYITMRIVICLNKITIGDYNTFSFDGNDR